VKTIVITLVALFALLLVPAGALAANASGGAGRDFGQHHAGMARDGMLGADMNPGHHFGFSGWEHH
jgi:hypothetical protein